MEKQFANLMFFKLESKRILVKPEQSPREADLICSGFSTSGAQQESRPFWSFAIRRKRVCAAHHLRVRDGDSAEGGKTSEMKSG